MSRSSMHDSLLGHAVDLARHEATPFYVYDTARLRQTCRALRSLPAAPRVYFATMANAHPRFLAVIRDEGLGVFVNTMGHLRTALEVGFEPARIIYTASGMSEALMRQVQATGAEVNLDSIGQVARWRALFPGQPFGIRCNIGDRIQARETRGGFFVGSQSRLGLSGEELEEAAGSADIHGLHLYAGTDILDIAYFESCYRALLELIPGFPGLRYLDLGGGFGVPGPGQEPFDFAAYGALVATIMDEAEQLAGRRLELVLEPGRIVGAEAGAFACRVTDVKRRGDRQLVGVDASSAQFPRPLLYPDSAWHPHHLQAHDGRGLSEPLPSQVYGCSTYSRDFLVWEGALPAAQPGDLVLLGQAGAYCASLHTRFLGFPPAPEHYR
jgi:diaminopimelate decarboxylase